MHCVYSNGSLYQRNELGREERFLTAHVDNEVSKAVLELCPPSIQYEPSMSHYVIRVIFS